MYYKNYIRYKPNRNGATITEIRSSSFLSDQSVIIIPRLVSGREVVSISKNAFISENESFPNFVIPSTVKLISKGAFVDKKNNHSSSKIWIANRECILYWKHFDYLIEISKSEWKKEYVESMNSYLYYGSDKKSLHENHIELPVDIVINNRITRPQNGKWEYGDRLVRYTGNDESVIIDSQYISSYAFYGNESIKEIIFRHPNLVGESHMIDTCWRLMEIYISKNAEVPDDWIYDCRGLRNIEWNE